MSRPAQFCLIVLLLLHTASAQTSQTPLELGKPIDRELSGGQTHAFSIALAAGQYAHAVAVQHGIDVVVVFRGPDGQKIVTLDTPSGDLGPEPVSVVAEVSGTYLLEVTSLDNDAPKGRYQLKLDELRTATPQDKSRITAQQAFTDAKPLRNQRTRESYRKAIQKYQEALNVWRAVND